MRSFNTRGAQAQHRLENFSGLQYHAPAKDTAAPYDLCNLRRNQDGTLSRRESFFPIAKLPDKVRGVYCCRYGDAKTIYAVAGEKAFVLLENGTGGYMQIWIGDLQSSEGEVTFFSLDGDVILADGVAMYRLLPMQAQPVTPYIPLYGKDWTSTEYGQIYEQRNVLTDQIHVRYAVENSTYSIPLGIQPLSIDKVVVGGEERTADSYTYNATSKQLNFTKEVRGKQKVDVLMTMPSEESEAQLREDFYRCRCAVRPGESGRSVMLFGGGNTTGVLYLTREIAVEDRKRCREVLPTACMLYLTADGRMEMGDGIHDVTAMVRHYDRTLIMTEEGTWTTDAQSLATGAAGTAFRMVNSRLGCSAPGAAVSVGNSPMSVFGGNLLLWTADTDDLDECNAEVCSADVAELLPDAMATQGRICPDIGRNEVWFYLPDGSARVFVWQQPLKSWTTYDFGKYAPQHIFSCGTGMGMASGETIFLFRDDEQSDVDADGTAIPVFCRYLSHQLDFGHKGQTIRPYEVMLCVEAPCDCEVNVTVETAAGNRSGVCMITTGDKPCEMQKRVKISRCRHAALGVDCAASGPFVLRMVGVVAGQ